MFKPEGIYAAMLTPFSADGTVNEISLRRMVEFLIQAGIQGLFPISSVGEFVHLSREEKMRMMEIVVDQGRGRIRVTPGVGSSHPAESIRLAEKAKALGCDGVVIAPPYYYPLSQGMVEEYYETIIAAVQIPVILYNIPLFTQPLGYDVVERLSRHGQVVAMKDSSGSMVDFMHFLDKIRTAGSRMNVLTGREETLLACLMVGGKGCMTATAGILPEIMVGIYRAWQEGDPDRARELQFSILPAVRAMFALPFPLGFKIALETRGIEMGPPKQPLSAAERSRYDAVKADIQKIMKSLPGDRPRPA